MEFRTITNEEMMDITAGGWNEFGKALTGTALIAGGFIVSAVPGGQLAGVGMVGLGIAGVASTAN